MALAAPLRKVASKLMARFGGVAVIRKATTGVYNSTTGTISKTSTDTTLRGILEDINKREVNDLVQTGDKKLIIAAADIATPPTTADSVVINSRVHQVIRVTTIEQDNQSITHELILRD